MQNNTNVLKEFLGLKTKEDVKEITLGVGDKKSIKKLIETAQERRFIIYFDSFPVEEIYDGYEFVDEEEEFYYYNQASAIVFRDITDFKIRIDISTIKKTKKTMTFEAICNAVRIATEYTKKHPEVSRSKLYN